MGVLHTAYRVGLIAEQNELSFSVYICLYNISKKFIRKKPAYCDCGLLFFC